MSTDDKNLLGYVTRFGSPADLEAITAIVDAKESDYYHSELFWYGNPNAIPWFIKSLSAEDIYRRMEFHRLILDFFDEESDIRKKGSEFLEFDSDKEETFPPASKLQEFWSTHKKELDTLLDNTRYYGSSIFNMHDTWAYEEYSDRRGFVSDRRLLLMI